MEPSNLDHGGDCRWIRFDPVPVDTKTNKWAVVEKSTGEVLGHVKWLGRWRRYVFSATDGCVLEWQCLTDIADFCVHQTKAHSLLARNASAKTR